jgi:hypothetical protein
MPKTIDIPIWDNIIEYRTEMFVERQQSRTVLSGTETSAKEQMAMVLKNFIGRQIGIDQVTSVNSTETKERVLVVNVAEARELHQKLEAFLKENAQ